MPCVEAGMFFEGKWRKLGAMLVLVSCAMIAGVAGAAEVEMPTRDALVYKDGDRVQGKFIERVNDVIVFQSERFGELRVPAADAVVVMADKPVADKTAPVVAATGKPSEHKTESDRRDEERLKIWEWFSPWVLTARVRDYFGPWHGRFAFSTELVSDTADRSNLALEGHLQRKWESNEVQINGRYDYAETNQLVTTDTFKGAASYRHDFSKARFGLYRPTVEWNRASLRDGVPNEYILLQQEVGVGFTVVAKPSRTVRAGVSANLFDVWNTAPQADHTSRAVESLFEEAELKLPWRMTLSQRGVWYYPISSERDGWENRVELNKKLTETLSVAVRHEIRRNNPNGSAQDYTRLKLLLGLDF
ncbi:MAG TPA: DUF481 domain-containing protein [Opitutaceae bacterium]|nr:DUF481 domain-containing protein [Opitutaceae bacterium]